jgi:cardiolipin synthase
VLAVLGYFPWWLFTLVMLRDLVIIGGAFYYHYRVTRISRADPTPLSKLNTLLQILLIVGIMWGLAYGGAVQNWVGGLIYVVAASTVASGLQYVIVWSRKAREHDDP